MVVAALEDIHDGGGENGHGDGGRKTTVCFELFRLGEGAGSRVGSQGKRVVCIMPPSVVVCCWLRDEQKATMAGQKAGARSGRSGQDKKERRWQPGI